MNGETVMRNESAESVAEQFIKDQLKIMEKYGHAPNLTPDQYKTLLSQTRKSFEALRPQAAKPAKVGR